jgi:hypothetical protein
MFEKYWSKATYKKKKDPADEKPGVKEARPAMAKIGTCKMIAEPHTFDVTIFVSRDPNAPQPIGDRPFVVQYGPPSKAPNTGTLAAVRKTVAHPTPIPATPTQKPAYNTHSPSIAANRPAFTAPPTRPPPSSPPSSKKPAATPTVATDPVIQMLAQRATTDNALKQVMKIVASGSANPKQLDYFQGHIDELTRIVNERNERKLAEETRAGSVQQSQQRWQAPSKYPPATPSVPPAQHQVVPAYAASYSGPPKVPIPPRPVYHPPLLTPKPRTIPAPTHVLLEFGVNSADRYLFPRNSIVEYEADGTVRASFFVVKKRADLPSANPLLGKKYLRTKKSKKDEAKANAENAAEEKKVGVVDGGSKGDTEAAKPAESSPKTDPAPAQKEPEPAAKQPEQPQKDVFQPVTIRFEQPSDPSMMQVFGRVVAPPAEVVKWMTDVASRCDRAQTARLALRLPKGSSEKGPSEKDTSAHAHAVVH